MKLNHEPAYPRICPFCEKHVPNHWTTITRKKIVNFVFLLVMFYTKSKEYELRAPVCEECLNGWKHLQRVARTLLLAWGLSWLLLIPYEFREHFLFVPILLLVCLPFATAAVLMVQNSRKNQFAITDFGDSLILSTRSEQYARNFSHINGITYKKKLFWFSFR